MTNKQVVEKLRAYIKAAEDGDVPDLALAIASYLTLDGLEIRYKYETIIEEN